MIVNAVMVTGDNIQMLNSLGLSSLYLWLPRIGIAQRNTMTSAWGLTESGRMWYCLTTGQLELWNGTQIVLVA